MGTLTSRTTTISALALAGILAFTGCSATSNADNAESQASASAAASPSPQPTTSTVAAQPTTPENPIAEQSIATLEELGIEIGKTVKVKGGSYPQYTIRKDSPLAAFNQDKQDGGLPKGWSKTDVSNAQQFAANFLLNFVLDNPTLNDYKANQEILIGQYKKVIDPQYTSAFVESVKTKTGGVLVTDTFTDGFTGTPSMGFRYVSDGQTPRIADLPDMVVTSSNESDGMQFFTFQGSALMNVIDKKSDPYTMLQGISYGIAVSKVGGEFKIGGAQFYEGKYTDPLAVDQ